MLPSVSVAFQEKLAVAGSEGLAVPEIVAIFLHRGATADDAQRLIGEFMTEGLIERAGTRIRVVPGKRLPAWQHGAVQRAAPGPDEKTCRTCGESYPATPEFFFRHNTYHDRLYPDCKDCYAAARRQRNAAVKRFVQPVNRRLDRLLRRIGVRLGIHQ